MSISHAILQHVEDALVEELIDNVVDNDPSRAGVVIQGPLQGNPDPDAARISLSVYENDPEGVYKTGTSTLTSSWEDEVAEIECGGSITMRRRFSVQARCLLVNTQEELGDTREIASDIKRRVERTLLNLSFTGIADDNEYVSKGVLSRDIRSESIQGGGPPDAYDYHIKVRFQVETTQGVQP